MGWKLGKNDYLCTAFAAETLGRGNKNKIPITNKYVFKMIENNNRGTASDRLARMKSKGKPFVSFFRVKPECKHLFNQNHYVGEMSPELYAEVFKKTV